MSNLTLRLISAAVLLPLVIALILFAPWYVFSGAMAVIAALAGFEYGTITMGDNLPGHRFVVAVSSGLVCASLGFVDLFPMGPVIAFLSVVPGSMLIFMFTANDLKVAVPASSYAATGAIYTGTLFGIISNIMLYSDEGRYWILLLIAGAVLSDTFAYTFGRLLGVRKLAPRISPGKTWAGAFGGVFGAMAAVAVAKVTLLPQLEWHDIAYLGITLSLFCQVGDLAESFLKRGFGVKDSGNIIPGHGGILDRCDAILFGAPIILLFSILR